MKLPENYKLRANFRLVFSELCPGKYDVFVAETVAGISEMNGVRFLKEGSGDIVPKESGSQPVIRVCKVNNQSVEHGIPAELIRKICGWAEHISHSGLFPPVLQISSFSASTDPVALVDEALMIQSLINKLVTGTAGFLVDDMAMFAMSFEQFAVRHSKSAVSNLFQFHVVKQPDCYWVHSHGLARFACPDLEWCLPLGIDTGAACDMMNRIIDHMVHDGNPLDSDIEMQWNGSHLRLYMGSGTAGDDGHYGGNEVCRISVESGPDLLQNAVNQFLNSHLTRREYFYGTQR